jgi:RNA polymerase sigma-70 factor (ECF subfamily)
VATRVTDFRGQGDYTTVDDRLLVLDFQAGNPEAFVEIHRRYGPLAKHVCRRFLPNGQDAEEAFQETMIRVFQGLFRFNGQYALQPWVARIATNVSLDQIRTKARRPQLDEATIEDHEHEDPKDGPEELVERLFERDLVLAVLADLPESHRTALVLRELEGRSHKEIADRLGISSAQAKALIHRAKGTFRRAWLLRMTERGGLAGFALAPLLWMLKALGGLKRFGDKAVQAAHTAQVATPELVSSAVAAPAQPAVSSLTERAVAAGMTLLLAGGVTVGAATIAHRHNAGQAAAVRAEAPAPSPREARTAPSPQPAATEPDATKPVERPDRGHHVVMTVPTPQPTPEPSAEPTAEPTTDPSATPTPDPSPTDSPTTEPTPDPTTEPPIGPAPDFSMSFSSSTTSVETCDCDPTPKLIASNSQMGEDGNVDFSLQMRGAAYDAQGDATWPLFAFANGETDAGRLTYNFSLTSGAGRYLYRGSATLTSTTSSADGSVTYRFDGTYELLDSGAPVAGLPYRGSMSAAVDVWPDGTVFGVSFQLHDQGA